MFVAFFVKKKYIMHVKPSEEQKQQLENIYQTFLNDSRIKRMEEISMHRGSNCYFHCFKVAKKAVRRSFRSFNKKINYEAVLIGAILHDYYLYDWRKDRSKRKKHARNHPFNASENASRDFDISKKVKRIIETHMWPINIKDFPKSKEARIVSLCDKAVTIGEVLTSKKYKQNKREKYLNKIAHLF